MKQEKVKEGLHPGEGIVFYFTYLDGSTIRGEWGLMTQIVYAKCVCADMRLQGMHYLKEQQHWGNY